MVRTFAASTLVLALSLVGGCINKQVFFHDPDNPKAIGSCKASAWGLIPTIMEASTEGDCETYYINHGYIRD